VVGQTAGYRSGFKEEVCAWAMNLRVYDILEQGADDTPLSRDLS